MVLSRAQRLTIKAEIADALAQRDWVDIDHILREFDQPISDQWSSGTERA